MLEPKQRTSRVYSELQRRGMLCLRDLSECKILRSNGPGCFGASRLYCAATVLKACPRGSASAGPRWRSASRQSAQGSAAARRAAPDWSQAIQSKLDRDRLPYPAKSLKAPDEADRQGPSARRRCGPGLGASGTVGIVGVLLIAFEGEMQDCGDGLADQQLSGTSLRGLGRPADPSTSCSSSCP